MGRSRRGYLAVGAAAAVAIGLGTASARAAEPTYEQLKQEVDQLRDQVAAQQKTIEELKAMVEKLAGEKQAEAKAKPADTGAAHATDSNNAVCLKPPICQAD